MPDPPTVLPFLVMDTFSLDRLAVKELHLSGGFSSLLDFLNSKPYLENQRMSCGGSLLFIIAVAIAHWNLQIKQFSASADWDESVLDFSDMDKLDSLCKMFCADFSDRSPFPTYPDNSSTASAEEDQEMDKDLSFLDATVKPSSAIR